MKRDPALVFAYASLALAVGLTIAALLSGCSEETTRALNTWNVEEIFRHDGCTGYVASRPGRYDVYFVKCSTKATTQWTERHGKWSTQRTSTADTEVDQ